MIRISNIKLPVDFNDGLITKKLCNLLRCDKRSIRGFTLFKLSIDARKKNDIHFLSSIDVYMNIPDEKVLSKYRGNNAQICEPYKYQLPAGTPNDTPPIVIGAGPAGLFAGLILAQAGFSPIIIERGETIDKRTKDVECFSHDRKLKLNSNVQFGEGGAGAFSDGKLNTGTKDTRARKVLEEFVLAGAPNEILWNSKPHIGTDFLHTSVKAIREKIKVLGGKFMFSTTVTDFIIKNGKICGLITDKNDTIDCERVILALGHSSRDTYKRLSELGISMQQKPFSIGVRIEHQRQLIDRAQYGNFAGRGRLGAADYKLATHLKNGRGVYTFCMCPGGVIVPAASEEHTVVTNGMSRFARDSTNSNSAILVGVSPADFESESVLAGIEFQRKFEQAAFKLGGENYNAPAQRLGDFLSNNKTTYFGDVIPSYLPGVEKANLNQIMPDYLSESLKEGIVEFGLKLKGFAGPDAVLTGMETRSSAPVRILRNEYLQSPVCKGLYPCGEGAGYAGGIISAAVDGIKCAEAIIKGD